MLIKTCPMSIIFPVITYMRMYEHTVVSTQELESLRAESEDSEEEDVHRRPARAEPAHEHDKHSIRSMLVVVAQYWRTILPAGTFVFALSLVRGAR